jgi:DNA polymerase-3 subunit gamma/tau
MSESVLYRRYRPATFDDLIGQDHVVKTMRGAVYNDAFAHAYLFAGSRGTGKTSVARIFADGIGVSSDDLYEIDAASNRGIDDVRELREAVNARPMSSLYKLYIIDEVHMLTKEAFNALLKTLEEPPSHVVFVLATTELHKLPDTIVSRCQLLTFNQPTQQILRDMAIDVATQEGYTLDAGAADIVALLGEGSFRDTLGMLQKVLTAAEGKKIDENEVAAITGAPRIQTVNELVRAIGYQDTETALARIRDAARSESDVSVLSALVIRKFRTVLLLRFAPDLKSGIEKEVSEDEFAFLKGLKGDTSYVITSHTLQTLLDAHQRICTGAIPQLPLELAIVHLSGAETEDGDHKRDKTET